MKWNSDPQWNLSIFLTDPRETLLGVCHFYVPMRFRLVILSHFEAIDCEIRSFLLGRVALTDHPFFARG